MTFDFATFMSKLDNSHYPFRFLASDYFTPYWKYFTPSSLEREQVQAVQLAARACVHYAMQAQKIYWLIDFSEEHALSTWRIFIRTLKDLPINAFAKAKTLCMQLAVPSAESDTSSYTMNLIARLRFDPEYRDSLNFSSADAEILDVAYDELGESLLNMSQITSEYLASASTWDVLLRTQTPDFPESISIIFSMAYTSRSALPLIRANLQTLFESEEAYRAFIRRFEQAFGRSLSPHMNIGFPSLLRM